MIIERLIVGAIETNCYLVGCPETRETMVVDPGEDGDKILARIEGLSLDVQWIVLTHAHADHLCAAGVMKTAFPTATFAVHLAESAWLASPRLNLSAAFGEPVKAPRATRTLDRGDTIKVGALQFEVLHVPGHSPGSIALYAPARSESEPGVVFSGDALFAGSIGRADLGSGSHPELIESIRTRLLTLPDDTVVYPGHGEITAIGHEAATNPFLT